MTPERILELLKIERMCVSRGEHCDRECSKCDLVQNTEELLEMYDTLIGWYEKALDKKRRDVLHEYTFEEWFERYGYLWKVKK